MSTILINRQTVKIRHEVWRSIISWDLCAPEKCAIEARGSHSNQLGRIREGNPSENQLGRMRTSFNRVLKRVETNYDHRNQSTKSSHKMPNTAFSPIAYYVEAYTN
jgi:hypothetical protein